MNYIITTQHPAFGKGYFTGFKNGGHAYFQSLVDHRVKVYATIRNANKQLARILADAPDELGEITEVENTSTLPDICALIRKPSAAQTMKRITG